ncbi:MAG: phosphate ABC transporter permease subunit PstC [Hyphomicrobium sp.]|nr:phosphate ABC transporter permease subunit PstC [Hyphomicrobium sp.]PPC79887.1 MAG: phosphate ABC transporter permease subunit PstC [Hyphomicrobium sp.]
MSGLYFGTIALLMIAGFVAVRGRAQALASTGAVGSRLSMHSLPMYHGLLAVTLVLLPMLVVYLVGSPIITKWSEAQALSKLPSEVATNELARGAALRDVYNIVTGKFQGEPSAALKAAADALRSTSSLGSWLVYGLGVALAGAGLLFSFVRVGGEFRARNMFERIVKFLLLLCATVAVLTTIGIVFSVLYETLRFFFDPALKGRPTVSDFLFGTEWNPQAALRADQGDIKTAFGFIPLLTGTLLITLIAISVAGPLGLLSAIYLAEYASPRFRTWAKPILEILAGIPTVVLGFFAALTVAPLIRGWGESFGLDIASESALAAGLVMGMMIIPFISSLSDDVINAVPQSMRDGSYALGATKSETIRQVILPAALGGIVSAFMLAISRAIGETMIVVMAAGLAANLTFNPLDAVTTITVQIKTILVGDQEFDSAKTLAAFALGLVLFLFTLILNVIALIIVRRNREQYD